jgi:hypothetical protein
MEQKKTARPFFKVKKLDRLQKEEKWESKSPINQLY